VVDVITELNISNLSRPQKRLILSIQIRVQLSI